MALANGTVEIQYSQSVQANGGVGPYHWTVNSGALPHNLELNPSNTSTVTISGMPDTPIQADAFSLKVTDSANQTATQPYQVSILGVPDTLTLSPSNLSFNPQLVSTASSTETMTLSNSGSAAVAINSVVAAGTDAADFSQSNTCTSGIAPGASCTITVTFTPSQVGPRIALITISDDTVGTPHTLGLNGVGLSSGANATLSASNLTFSGQAVGTTSPAQTLTLTNYGTATLNVASIAATGDFAESSTCGASLASVANCAISILFTPSALGNVTGTLSVKDNLTGSPQTASLSGTGMTSQGTLAGYCFGTNLAGCYQLQDLAACPVGTAATSPVHDIFNCPHHNSQQEHVDSSRGCQVQIRTGVVTGLCMVN